MNADPHSARLSGNICSVWLNTKNGIDSTDGGLCLGSQFIQRVLRLRHQPGTPLGISDHTREIINTLDDHSKGSSAVQHWRHAVSKLNDRRRLQTSMTEHMSSVDAYDGEHARKGLDCKTEVGDVSRDLVEVTPSIDGRLKDMANEIKLS